MPAYFNTRHKSKHNKKSNQIEQEDNDLWRQEDDPATDTEKSSTNAPENALDEIVKRVMAEESRAAIDPRVSFHHNPLAAELEDSLERLAPTKPDDDWDYEEDERQRKKFNARIDEKWGRPIRKDPILEVAEKIVAEEQAALMKKRGSKKPDQFYYRSQDVHRQPEVTPSDMWYRMNSPHPLSGPVSKQYWDLMKHIHPPRGSKQETIIRAPTLKELGKEPPVLRAPPPDNRLTQSALELVGGPPLYSWYKGEYVGRPSFAPSPLVDMLPYLGAAWMPKADKVMRIGLPRSVQRAIGGVRGEDRLKEVARWGAGMPLHISRYLKNLPHYTLPLNERPTKEEILRTRRSLPPLRTTQPYWILDPRRPNPYRSDSD